MTDEVKAAVERVEAFKGSRIASAYPTLASALAVITEALSRLTEENEREHRVCDGCGTSRSDADIKAGGFVSCCPERKMLTAKEWHDRATKAEAERDEALEALKPFADEAWEFAGWDDEDVPETSGSPAKFSVADLRRAAALLAQSAQKEGA